MRKLPAVCLLVLLAPLAFATTTATQQGNQVESNPFFQEWTTPFGIAPFASIRNEHFLPAFEAGIAERRAEVAAIVGNAEPATFANTVEALEDGGRMLDKVGAVFFNLTSAETSDELQAIATKVAPMLSALRDDIMLDEKLFARVKAVWAQRAELKLDAEQAKLLDEAYKSFVRGGANLAPEAKERLRAINQELAVSGLKFSDNLLKQTNAFRLVIENEADLAGLPPGVVASGADAAKAAGMAGKWVYTLHSPSIWPFVSYADDRDLRRRMIEAYTSRCDNGDEFDNKKILSRIAALRAERAKLLGYATHADFVLEENMAKNPAGVYELLGRLWKPALAVARQEADALQAAIKVDGKDFALAPWDWRYYAEKVRKQRYAYDEEAVRPYFELDRVREGAFWLAGQLYGLKFVERTDVPTYHPEVKTFEVREADGRQVGLFMVDYHPRPGKRGGAWCNTFRDQWVRDGKRVAPIVTNVGNFSRPTGGAPALLTLDEAETLFHEFGHALHALLTNVRYRSLGEVPRDFVELPSQIMENWLLEPDVLKVYARHYSTGEVIPAELVEKIHQAQKFNQGFVTVEYLAASLLDMDWHTLKTPAEQDATAFEKASLTKWQLVPEIVSRYRSPYFQHIFGPGGGYSAGYYSYIWSEVLDSDAFNAFKEKGLFDKTTAASFRANVLERAGTGDVAEAYRRFRGKDPSVEPLLAKRGLVEAAPAASATK